MHARICPRAYRHMCRCWRYIRQRIFGVPVITTQTDLAVASLATSRFFGHDNTPQFRAQFPMHDTLRVQRFKSCAVVGSAGHLLDSTLGACMFMAALLDWSCMCGHKNQRQSHARVHARTLVCMLGLIPRSVYVFCAHTPIRVCVCARTHTHTSVFCLIRQGRVHLCIYVSARALMRTACYHVRDLHLAKCLCVCSEPCMQPQGYTTAHT